MHKGSAFSHCMGFNFKLAWSKILFCKERKKVRSRWKKNLCEKFSSFLIIRVILWLSNVSQIANLLSFCMIIFENHWIRYNHLKSIYISITHFFKYSFYVRDHLYFHPKRTGLLVGILFGKMKFVLSNFLSKEDLSISYESWDIQLTFDTLINAFRFKA